MQKKRLEDWVHSQLGFQKRKKDFEIFLRLFFANDIYMEQF